MAKKNLPQKFQVWVDARNRFHLSHAQVQMARELGMNPNKFGGLANHRQERWKVSLPNFIEELYFKRFGRELPETVLSIEDLVKKRQRKREEKKAAREATVVPDQVPDVERDVPF